MQNGKSRNDVRGRARADKRVRSALKRRASELRDARRPQLHEDLLGEPRAMAIPPTRDLLIAATDSRGWVYVVQTAVTAHACGNTHLGGH